MDPVGQVVNSRGRGWSFFPVRCVIVGGPGLPCAFSARSGCNEYIDCPAPVYSPGHER